LEELVVFTSVLYVPPEPAVWPWAAVVVLVALVAAAACAWPTWRALRVDPVVALAVE
jgi:ABC-type lipoprotein release transport system permease subunit